MHVINKNGQNIIMETCFFCSRDFHYGNHIYDGKYIKCYDVPTCKKCWDGNWDGWVGKNAERLIEHLKSKNIPVPDRNEKGWVPRGI